MAYIKWNFRVLSVFLFFGICALEPVDIENIEKFEKCSNSTVSCSSQFINKYAPDTACRLLTVPDCAGWTFKVNSYSSRLGSVILKTYPYAVPGYSYSVFNVTFTDIKWTTLRFRFKQLGFENKHFCREFHVSQEYNIPELFYDCLWTKSNYEGRPFMFEYEARSALHTESRRYKMNLPVFNNIRPETALQNWTPFLYVDISELPVLKVKWQQAPKKFGVQKYKLVLYNKVEGSEEYVRAMEVIEGTDNEDSQLSYVFDTFPTSGNHHFEIRVLNDSCKEGLCQVSVSPAIIIDDFLTHTLVVGIVGSVVLIPLFLFILYMWKKQCHPPTGDVKLPVVLIIYTPSRATHVQSVIALTEYLRNYCFVEALLDQLDIPKTETKDPFTWCNEAFSRADFVMVVSSPSSCCKQEGIFRNVDVVALRFLKENLSKCSSRSRFFAVLLPYCTKQDIPAEAKNLRTFRLTEDLDLMLWYIHNGGRFPSVIDSARTLLGPKPCGGKSELKTRGTIFVSAIEAAEKDVVEICNCKRLKTKENGSEDTKCVLKNIIPDVQSELTVNKHSRNISDSNSTDCLWPDPESAKVDFKFPFNLGDMDLSGTKITVMSPRKNDDSRHLVMDLNNMAL